MSQLPSSVKKRRAKPRMSRSASAAPRSPATVENRANISVCLPIWEKILAREYWVMSLVTVKVPQAPEPLACIRRSGMTSRSKWANFSKNHTSWSSIGPRGPAVTALSLSQTGAPAAVVTGRVLSWVIPYLLRRESGGSVNRGMVVSSGHCGLAPSVAGAGQLALGAGAPVDDLGGLDREAVIIAGVQAWGLTDGTRHVADGATPPAHHVVVVVAAVEFEPARGAVRLDAAQDSSVGQSVQHVIDGLGRDGAQTVAHRLPDGFGGGVRVCFHFGEHGEPRRGDPQVSGAKQLGVGGSHAYRLVHFPESFKFSAWVASGTMTP